MRIVNYLKIHFLNKRHQKLPTSIVTTVPFTVLFLVKFVIAILEPRFINNSKKEPATT